MLSTQPPIQPNITRKHPLSLQNTLNSYTVSGRKAIAVLLDPDKVGQDSLIALLNQIKQYPVDFFFMGGSLVSNYTYKEIIALIRQYSSIPVVLFPGNPLHIEPSADAILFLSLISGRNSDFLIGQHVIAAPLLKKSGLEILPTGYMLVDSGTQTTVSYISGTMPLPYDKPDVAACTAMAGEMLGLKTMYLDAGSGARRTVSPEMIAAVRAVIGVPLIVGGGINSGQKAYDAFKAGANLIVVGNGIEQNPDLLPDLAAVLQEVNQSVVQA